MKIEKIFAWRTSDGTAHFDLGQARAAQGRLDRAGIVELFLDRPDLEKPYPPKFASMVSRVVGELLEWMEFSQDITVMDYVAGMRSTVLDAEEEIGPMPDEPEKTFEPDAMQDDPHSEPV